MPEPAARSSAGPRAVATHTQDGNHRRGGDFRPVRDGNRTAPAERNLQVVPGGSSGGERTRLADPPRRTVVIRGQVADRYSTTPNSARTHRISGSYDLRLRPERAALWAVLLGLALVIVALASAHI